MITPEWCQMMARYNAWQNRSLLGAADGLSEDDRRADRGAFWGSIHATLSHILWGDLIWMSRFADWEEPPNGITGSTDAFPDWDAYKAKRSDTDQQLEEWAARLKPDDLKGDLTWYSGAAGREISKPRDLLITHMFNHQTHHRGQVHAMLTAAGARPDDTDIPFMPDEI